MSWNSAPTCPICGNAHHDGMNVVVNGKELFLCFDCADEIFENREADTESEAELDF